MSCNTCNIKFNFFHKELGCANCGMSFCNKCLKQKCKIPSKGLSELNVCRICFNKLMKSNEPVKLSFEPPDMLLKRLENLQNPSAPTSTVNKHNPKLQELKTDLSPSDQSLVDRLEKLKENESKSQPLSETELRERLSRLKGENSIDTSEKYLIFPVDNRTNEKKVDDLLEQFTAERGIELNQNTREDIETRLAALQEKGVRPSADYISNLDSDDSEDEVEKITRKIMEEAALDDKSSKFFKSHVSNSEEKEDVVDSSSGADVLPWCILCNNDAQFKCIDCGGDLYCEKCNREVHKEWDRDHQVVPFTQK